MLKSFSNLGAGHSDVTHGLDSDDAVLLFRMVVHPLLDNASAVWSPHQVGHVDQIKSIQKCFMNFVGCCAGFNYFGVHVNDLSAMLDFHSLRERSKMSDISFLYRIMNNKINCPELLQ